ncbi:Retinoic acid induced 16-like protein-domain-containing protein [Gamsiella multidivaricata]|uniref:Retinoic acid induced 16-like protein-domain-containing protein n=1 Tax=Gamsiella multidivaricata TaxID=101098 RepID=UPI00221F9B82|nr:Retinoic acid induced 16-like protein-domain-containing protein [Gamsiella multidivaricata]KAG0356399.1 hypothetical protein BGZ54_000739 [Gamsiella multidivaricata]KAI7817818.1 Retinoic acid induced 16-like protein-domain-containing protein [Gamsiella multidivaricata]
MEPSFWNKLRKSLTTAPKTQPSSAVQLTRFNKCWTTIQNGFSTPEKRSLYVQQTEIPARLKNMVDLLVDEESRLDDDAAGTTGVCMEYLLKHNILAKLVNMAEGDQPKGIMGETIRTIAAMINLLDDRFLVHNAVHKPTVKLLRTCASGTELQGESYHEDLVDLMYIVCSKIHGYPELLNIFFHDKQWLTVPQRVAAKRIQKNLQTMEMLKNLRASTSENAAEKESPSQPLDGSQAALDSTEQEEPASEQTSVADGQGTQQTTPAPKSDYEFLLFTYLSKFVHREGKTGDFARTGLLFLMELATGSLGEYIIESDFTSFLSAGVGASYSQLPRKLLVRGGPNTINSMVGTLNDRAPPTESTPSRRANIELSTSTDFQSRLDAFLKLLEFCQDIMMRCPNSEIVDSLLNTFKTVFLENILFPSIMECSDTDGSSVAVISYIDLILQVLEHEALVDLVLGFLMSSEDDNRATGASQDTDDAFAEIQNPQTTSSYFTASGRFTLKDLILSRLKSRSQPTVIATLKLLNTLITRHCKYSLKLLSIQPDIKATSFRDMPGQSNGGDGDLPLVSHHVHELDLFYALISTINPHNTAEIFCHGYESYLRDAEGAVETHQCYLRSKEIDGSQATPGQLSALERKKQRRRSMKYGQKMDLPDDLSGDAFLREQEKNTEAMAALSCCDKPRSHPVPLHRLLPSDPLLQILLGTLSHFFAHSVELNLALTGVITSLAVCPYRSLEGWLLFKSTDIRNPGEDGPVEAAVGAQVNPQADVRFELGDSEDEDTLPSYLSRGTNAKASKSASASQASVAISDEATGATSFKSFPPFFTMLRTLTQQVDYYRSEIDGFDEYLADRRRILLVATELNSAIHTPGLSSQHRSQQYPQQYYQQQHQYPSSAFGSNESFANQQIASEIRSGHGTPTSMAGSSMSHGGPINPQFSGTSQRINTKNLAPEGAQSASSHTISSPKARKSSAPSSLMSSPSNMPFLDASGYRRPTSKPGSSSSSINSGSLPGGADSDMQSMHSATTMPSSVQSSRTAVSASASSYSSSMHSNSVGSRPPMASGMAGAAASVAGAQSSSWGSFTAKSQPVPNPVLVRTMETMMIKPLFPDGFVNDSDSEAENEAAEHSDLSEDEGAEGEGAEGAEDTPKKSKRAGQRTREASTSSSNETSETPSQQHGTHREKMVTLGQLLTNVVILEEVVKEVVAVAQVRRGLGVDKVRFL